MSIEPDTKDWTWVLREPCAECGYVAADIDRRDISSMVTANTEAWVSALAQPGVADRPRPEVWSPVEYACHVRDVNALFDDRLRRMIEEEDPLFANWDQDETAVAERYDLQDPGEVAPALAAAGRRVAAAYAALNDEQWSRPGRRSDGSEFTVESFARYHLHDVVHHLWDIGVDPVAHRAGGGE